MKREGGMISATRSGHTLIQGVLGLAAGGTVLGTAHALFLRIYQREWGEIQFTGPNECAGEERIANGDLFGGETICNKVENIFTPWISVYQHHFKVALIYYGLIFLVVFGVGLVWTLAQRRPPAKPFGTATKLVLRDNEHLR